MLTMQKCAWNDKNHKKKSLQMQSNGKQIKEV